MQKKYLLVALLLCYTVALFQKFPNIALTDYTIVNSFASSTHVYFGARREGSGMCDLYQIERTNGTVKLFNSICPDPSATASSTFGFVLSSSVDGFANYMTIIDLTRGESIGGYTSALNAYAGKIKGGTLFANGNEVYFQSDYSNGTVNQVWFGKMNTSFQYERLPMPTIMYEAAVASGNILYHFDKVNGPNHTLYKVQLPSMQVLNRLELNDMFTSVSSSAKMSSDGRYLYALVLISSNTPGFLKIDLVNWQLVLLQPAGERTVIRFSTSDQFLYYVYSNTFYQVSLDTFNVVNTMPLPNINFASTIQAFNDVVYVSAMSRDNGVVAIAVDVRCDMGQYVLPNKTCVACPSKTVSLSYDAAACSGCPVGSIAAVTKCDKCKPGSFSAVAGADCTPCPDKTFASDFGAIACSPCATANGTGNVECKVIPIKSGTPFSPLDYLTPIVIGSVAGAVVFLVCLCATVGCIVYAVVAARRAAKQKSIDAHYHKMVNDNL